MQTFKKFDHGLKSSPEPEQLRHQHLSASATVAFLSASFVVVSLVSFSLLRRRSRRTTLSVAERTHEFLVTAATVMPE